MQSTITYKCPNCDAPLTFNADKQAFSCEFCLSDFTKAELDETLGKRQADEAHRAKANEEFNDSINEYICQSCGAEVVADKDTAATFCYYCHNPVVMTSKVSGMLKPDKIIPFKFGCDEAKDAFLSFAKRHKFVPKNYFSKKQIENMQGIYFPFWVTDADASSDLSAKATKVRSWRSGDYRYTETSRYDIYRSGDIHFEDIVTSAISSEDKAMLEGILPYPPEAHKDFDMAYMSGYVAKKRDISREEVSPEVQGRMREYSEALLRDTAPGYTTLVTENLSMRLTRAGWQYALMPLYILTYRKKGKKKDKIFTYAMNGHTGKVYGELPISIPKITALFLGLFAGVSTLASLLGYFLFM